MPYGAGYLASMYLGYAASSKTGNLQNDIIEGLNKIFGELTSNINATLDDAISKYTGYSSLAAFERGFANADNSALNFVKAFLAEKGNGAGSLIGSSLSQKEKDLFAEGNLTSISAYDSYYVKNDNTHYVNIFGGGTLLPEDLAGIGSGNPNGDDGIFIQVGANAFQQVGIKLYNVSSNALYSGSTLDVMSSATAGDSIYIVDEAINEISRIRSYYGAIHNRLEHAMKNADNMSENLTSAESKIRDVDMAEEMVTLSKNNILLQVGQSILSQANMNREGVLALLM